MMATRGVNKVILVGNLGNDPEVRYMPNGDAVANLSLATSESWKDQQGQVQERTEWHRLTMYRRLAEVAGQYLQKGSQIYVEGKLHTRKWQDQQGQDRYTTEVIVENMQMLGGREVGSGNQQRPQGNQQSRQQGAPQNAGGYQQRSQSQGSGQPPQRNQQRPGQPPMGEPDFDFDDDIPFAPLFKQYRSMHYAI